MANQESLSIKRTFILLGIILTLSALGALFYIQWDTKRDRILDLHYTSSIIKNYYELSFHQWELSLLSVGKRLVEIKGEDAAERRLEYANRALKVYEEELFAFGLADTAGQVIAFTHSHPNDSLPHLMKSEKTRQSFIMAREKDHITVGESYYFDNVKDWIIPIRVPIKDDNGKLVALNTSAINHRVIHDELSKFGLDNRYKIHLVHKDFGTTQVYFPLEKEKYDGIIGRSDHRYEYKETRDLGNGSTYLDCNNPIDGIGSIGISTIIYPVNQELVVLVDKSVLIAEVVDRYKFIFLFYLILMVSSVLLYFYLKKSRQKYLSSKANLKSLFESTNSIIGLFDRNRKLIEFNNSFKHYAKMTDDIDLKVGLDVLNHMKSREHVGVFTEWIDRALSGEKVKETVEYPSPTGAIHFLFTYNPIYQDKEIKGVSMFVEDITEIKRYQKQLEEYSQNLEEIVDSRTKELRKKNEELANGYSELKATQDQLLRSEKMASLGILASGVGHEINNPLNFIKNGALALKNKILQLSPTIEGEVSTYFDIIDEGVGRASKIVKGLSHFSRSGESLDEVCDVKAVVDNCLVILSSRIKRKNLSIVRKIAVDDTTVIGSEGKLHQALLNILSNAEQATEQSGRIEISFKETTTYLVVMISDSGHGISQENISKISDPFYTTKPPGEGTGLGLFIAYSIIDEHHGVIEVSSKVNEGTTFTIKLLKKKYS